MDIKAEAAKRLAGHLLYSQENADDPVVHAKLFHAYGAGTWYLTEYDGNDTAFGYVTGLHADEWGYVSIDELAALHIGGSVPRIECDLCFEPTAFSALKVKGLV
jgi:Protein of unknown function (DUF2958)